MSNFVMYPASSAGSVTVCTDHLRASSDSTIVLDVRKLATEDEWRDLFRAAAEHSHVRVLVVRYTACVQDVWQPFPAAQLVYNWVHPSRSLLCACLCRPGDWTDNERVYMYSDDDALGMLATLHWHSTSCDDRGYIHTSGSLALCIFGQRRVAPQMDVVSSRVDAILSNMGIPREVPALPAALAYQLLDRLFERDTMPKDALAPYILSLAAIAVELPGPYASYAMSRLRIECVSKNRWYAAVYVDSDHAIGASKRIHRDTQGPWLCAEPPPEDKRWYCLGNGKVVCATAYIAQNSRVLQEMMAATASTSLGRDEANPIPIPMVEDEAALQQLLGMCAIHPALDMATALGMDITAYAAAGALAAYNTAFGIVSLRAAPADPENKTAPKQ